ncbi:hypothetical protein Sta7437_1385 [Stanieria cyanosphaera PCC 7437]|uniref:Uncharacterized protein n=1 Tax=Stanieria cyanosphaera (strain ATCC 29371 / PCC 7437) TaxID=111780 RepID=K9XTF8_STAC7|nr:hypothetical protein [Stanieria cyanosphaera]AFZ34952.1 hypothetical protein Sta7437_1385 [Stanieria cyanosphaera PCC 7437]
MTELPDLQQTIANLTRAQLEEIITEIAKDTIKQEMMINQQNQSQSVYKASQSLKETFGIWDDERTDEEIIKEIYDSRNSNLTST